MRIFLALIGALTLSLAGCSQNQPSPLPNSIYFAVDEFTGDSARGHWLAPGFIRLAGAEPLGDELYLVARDEAGELRRWRMRPVAADARLNAEFPHLAALPAYSLLISDIDARDILSDQLLVVGMRGDEVTGATAVQTAGVIDDLFSVHALKERELGATLKGDDVQFKLWAPTAKNINVIVEDQTAAMVIQMDRNSRSGIWTATVPDIAAGVRYRYEVDVFHPAIRKFSRFYVTDPYSLALTRGSEYSVIVDLDDPVTKPRGWDDHNIPTVDRPEELIIYESHIGDFSGTDETVPASYRGTYKAFTLKNTDGIRHLRRLQAAGLNVVHLLPTYDLGSIPETRDQQVKLSDTVGKACGLIEDSAAFCDTADPEQTILNVLESFDPATGEAQAVIEAIDEVDDYNWGYDPYHYTVPEGSYAVNADGAARALEFREMVQSLHKMGFRVIMDVVYNHTFQAGVSEKSVLDKIVPGYYHRLNIETGAIEQSTCCENTATENLMMAKLMEDSLVVWARDYRIDGFRFDLMGHQPRAAMLEAREAVRDVDPDTYFYGEGWNFGEVADNARFRQASQLELTGTEIGTFTDRLRDAVRGGSSFNFGDDIRKGQGLGNGVHQVWNELYTGPDETADTYALYADQVRIGLAGNLRDFEIEDRTGALVTGADVPYGGAPTGYAGDPADTINYVSKHDNQTLWDNNQYRIPFGTPIGTRVRMQALSYSYVMYAQGIPFLHMGGENLRSKSYLRDSYNYGHWFNAVDWSGQSNNYNVGLPPAGKDEANWPLITRILAGNQGRDMAGPDEIALMQEMFLDMLEIRSGSPLFSLPDAGAIKARIRFHNTGPEMQTGLIVMSISDGGELADLDPHVERIVVVFNHSGNAQSFTYDTAGLLLHPVLAESADAISKTAAAEDGLLTIPAWTTSVFVEPQVNPEH